MTVFGCFVLAVSVFSLYIGYRIFKKILKKKTAVKGEVGLLEKSFVLFFICLLMVCINSLAGILSCTFFWEKAYRTVSENKYEAVVTGYKKETVKSQNFKGSTYDNKVVYFPKVKYTDEEGKEVVKTLDMTSNHPPAIGQHLKITDAELRDSANSIGLDWAVFIFGGMFTGVTAFFAGLLSTYMTKYTLKRRIVLSLYIALIVLSVNVSCMVIIYLSQ